LSLTFHSVASRLSGGYDVTYEIMSFDVSADMEWTAGFVRFIGTMDGGPLTRYTLRLTHVYRREAGEWKVVHEHSDFHPTDQTPPVNPLATRSP
jgi:ketosteroid isomerase-like protein